MSNSYNIVPTHLVIQAMRDNGYKNAAYAIAELIDNAIQAGASQVELLCGERKQQPGEQKRRIEQIAVLDNGCGMDASVLRIALQFGNGTYLDESKHTGIGRFGMGLPSSSISQCKRIDVWSWQHGVENALYTYLDLDEIINQQMKEVPEPVAKPIPRWWYQVGESFGQTGTLIVWSKIDRCIWRTGKAIIDNSEFLIGRIYRKFINTNQVKIKMVSFDLDEPHKTIYTKDALANDPGYLMENTSCPAPYDKVPMFQPWEGDNSCEEIVTIKFKGQQHQVKMRFSYAKEEARQSEKGNPGDKPHGKHAKKNTGVSIVRAGRELELDIAVVNGHDTTERWWGVEVEFPPSLDELFGVTNNKQSARNLTEILKMDLNSLSENGKSWTQYKEELEADEDPKSSLLEIANRINNRLSLIRRLLKQQTKGTCSASRRYELDKTAKTATVVTKQLQAEGHQGKSDQEENLPKQEREKILKQTLEQNGIPEKEAAILAATTVNNDLKYQFIESACDNPAFFSVQPKAGVINVILNTEHPAYEKLVELLEKDVEKADEATLRSRLTNSLEALKLLLMAWARYEDEQPEGERKRDIQEARYDWGRIARRFLEQKA